MATAVVYLMLLRERKRIVSLDPSLFFFPPPQRASLSIAKMRPSSPLLFFTIVFTMVVDEAGALGLASPGDAFSISLPYAFVGAPNLTSVVADHTFYASISINSVPTTINSTESPTPAVVGVTEAYLTMCNITFRNVRIIIRGDQPLTGSGTFGGVRVDITAKNHRPDHARQV